MLLGRDYPILQQIVAISGAPLPQEHPSAPLLEVMQVEEIPLELPSGEGELVQQIEQDPMLCHAFGQAHKAKRGCSSMCGMGSCTTKWAMLPSGWC